MATASHPAIVRKSIHVRGIVQGVGFRPYVYNLAHSHGLCGYVLNSSSGVTIEAEGLEEVLEEFIEEVRRHPPMLARIEAISVTDIAAQAEANFTIRESLAATDEFVLVSPDISTCDQCWHDCLDRANQRYGYPFTNCTNCGPRYTIIRDIPYDRPLTTMAEFRMCPRCQAEYDDPGNRRFHAQPNACPACGPSIALARDGSFLPGSPVFGYGNIAVSILRDVREVLRHGSIVAIKGLGGFHLACDAENEAAVRLLRQRKKRSGKPFALMARNVEAAATFCEISAADRELLVSPQHPIVILPRRPDAAIAQAVAPGNNTVGVMLPYTPLQFFLFGEDPEQPPEFRALVMTSGNMSEEPIVTRNQEAWQRLGRVADWFLFHNRGIYMRVDDSVARTFEGRPRVLRRSRGYAPHPIALGSEMVELLACGAELKNTLCLTKGRYAILSQHIGDLDNYETLKFFEETLENLTKLFRVKPQAVAYDLHPLYLSSRYAQGLPQLQKIGVQHHHAHIASCMAENGLRDKVIGVALDGTGYGTDGQIWGGEFLVADFDGFERRAYFRYIPLPGGDAAVRQPWRVALSYLRDTFGDDIPGDLPLWGEVPDKQLSLVATMLARRLNTTLTSSCGRLFDAVASIIGLRHQVTFEAQAAIELEGVAQPGIDDAYEFGIEDSGAQRIDFRPCIADIVRDVKAKLPTAVISSRFHNTVAAAVTEVCWRIRQKSGLNRVCLSGGTFQNVYLLERAMTGLRAAGFDIFLHSNVPPNDGGIALGQAVIANQILQRGA
ncbi:MAG TPA: carbamoyltransferase HypF [Terriglobales bacterium]|nr:carbamoyltransferase HypF [Terriglobales bacterium]